MIDTIIKVSGTIPANAATNDIAAIDIPEDGELMCVGGIVMGIPVVAPGAGANRTIRLSAELSFLSTNQIAVNDARGSIAGLGVAWESFFAEAIETGGAGSKCSQMGNLCLPEGITLFAGERIHLHGSSNDVNTSGLATFVLYMKTKGGGRRDRSRR